jgi:nucleotide-binding universal stress UspA family protein
VFPPKRILFPVDFSERCTGAARMVETFAGHFQSELTLLYVLEPLTYNDIPFDATSLTEEQLQSYLLGELKHFDVNRVLVHGEPARQIAEYAHSRNFDLIMLPTHGYGSFRRFILGSVTAKVLHDALCPVWTGVHMEQVPRLEDIAFRNIVCAVDLGTQSCRTLRWANNFAAEFGASLQLIHAVPSLRHAGAGNAGAGNAGAGNADKLIFEATEQLRAIQECSGSAANVSILSDEVPEAVCGFAERDKADLLVIGRSVAEGMMGRLRANAYSIIRQSPCPVVSV